MGFLLKEINRGFIKHHTLINRGKINAHHINGVLINKIFPFTLIE